MKQKMVLACSICASRNYRTRKHTGTHDTRLGIRKYCKTCGEHTLHRETK